MVNRAMIIGISASLLFHLCILFLPVRINLKTYLANRFQDVRLSFYSIEPPTGYKTVRTVKTKKSVFKKIKKTKKKIQKITKNHAKVKKQKVTKKLISPVFKKRDIRERQPRKAEKRIESERVVTQKPPIIKETEKEPKVQKDKTEKLIEHSASDSKELDKSKVAHKEVMAEPAQPPIERGASGHKRVPTIFRGKFGDSEGPRFLKKIIPRYPRLARKLGKEGIVLLKLFIDKEGRLKKVEVLKDDGYGFASAAVKAIRQSTFLPAVKNGVPVDSEALLTIRFRIKK